MFISRLNAEMLNSPQTSQVFYLLCLRSSVGEKVVSDHTTVAGEQMDFPFPVQKVIGVAFRGKRFISC